MTMRTQNRFLLPLSVLGFSTLATFALAGCSSSSSTTETNPDGGKTTPTDDSGKKTDDGGKTKNDGGTTTGKDGGATTGDDSGGGGNNDDVAGFCENLENAVANLEAKCFGGSLSDWKTTLDAPMACASLEAGVTAKRLTYDPSKANACLSEIAAVTCDDTTTSFFTGDDCAATLVGNEKKGDACQGDLDCEAGNYCNITNPAACGGTCAAYAATGASCAAAQCAPADTCSQMGSSTMPVCVKSPPQPALAAKGKKCGYDSTTQTETSCETGLSCDQTTLLCVDTVPTGGKCSADAYTCEQFTYCAANGTCTHYPGIGEPCGEVATTDAGVSVSAICFGANVYCKLEGDGGTKGTCAAGQANGAACTEDDACASDNCRPGEAGASGTCVAACPEE